MNSTSRIDAKETIQNGIKDLSTQLSLEALFIRISQLSNIRGMIRKVRVNP